jgi:outer membrane protein
MKQLSLILSVIATLISGFLLVKQYSKTDKVETTVVKNASGEKIEQPAFRIAYFDIDSLQNKYQFFKDALAQLMRRCSKITNSAGSPWSSSWKA